MITLKTTYIWCNFHKNKNNTDHYYIIHPSFYVFWNFANIYPLPPFRFVYFPQQQKLVFYQSQFNKIFYFIVNYKIKNILVTDFYSIDLGHYAESWNVESRKIEKLIVENWKIEFLNVKNFNVEKVAKLKLLTLKRSQNKKTAKNNRGRFGTVSQVSCCHHVVGRGWSDFKF